jgi:hypothetical protein
MQASVATETIRRSHLLASSSSEENETDDDEVGASSPASAAYGSERHRTAIFLSAQIERIMRRKTRQTNSMEEPKLDATDDSVWYARMQRHSRTLTFSGLTTLHVTQADADVHSSHRFAAQRHRCICCAQFAAR